MGRLFVLNRRYSMVSTRITSNITNLRLFSSSFTKSYHLTGSGVKTKAVMSQPHLTSPIITDVPKLMGGKNEGPQPVELLLASLAGCELVTAQFIARNMRPRVTIDRIDFDMHASRDQRGAMGSLPIVVTSTSKQDEESSFRSSSSSSLLPPSRLERIWGTAMVHTSASSAELAMLAKEVKERCPIANMVILSGCTLEIEFRKA